jgi:hypothetical protein
MACFRQCSTAFSSEFPGCSSQSPEDQSERAEEAKLFALCAVAGVCCIGITADRVVFQPVGTSLSIPLSAFADAAKAIALIRAKLAEVQR